MTKFEYLGQHGINLNNTLKSSLIFWGVALMLFTERSISLTHLKVCTGFGYRKCMMMCKLHQGILMHPPVQLNQTLEESVSTLRDRRPMKFRLKLRGRELWLLPLIQSYVHHSVEWCCKEAIKEGKFRFVGNLHLTWVAHQYKWKSLGLQPSFVSIFLWLLDVSKHFLGSLSLASVAEKLLSSSKMINTSYLNNHLLEYATGRKE